MACPKCHCKTTYQYNYATDGEVEDDTLERCAACGHVFCIEEAEDEFDEQ